MPWTFKKIAEDDLPTLLAWFKEPHVQKWWPIPTQDEVYAHFLKRIRSKDTFGYLALLEGVPIGYIQYYYIDPSEAKTGTYLPPDFFSVVSSPASSTKLSEGLERSERTYRIVGTDQFIGDPNYLHKGYGTQFIKAFIDYLRTVEPHITTIIVDPEPTNLAAIHCYEKVGFKRVIEYDTPFGRALLMRYDISL